MKKLIFGILSWALVCLLIACAPDENTRSNQKQQDYIINPPDFEELERQKTEWIEKGRPPVNKKKPTLSKESVKAYIKELTHHFQLQEKQMKALEYIYEKYEKKERQAIQSNNTAQLAELSAEKEQSIAVVLGQHYYADKEKFDEKYFKEKRISINTNTKIKYGFFEIPPKGTKPLARTSNRYIEALGKELNLNQKQVTGLKSMMRQYNHSRDLLDSIEINQLNENKNKMEKEILGLHLYQRKLEFDQNY